MKPIIIGVDLGNYNTKSQNTIIPSGYEGPYKEPSMMGEGNLKYNGMYYVHSNSRLAYLSDKTKDDRGIILTLMSIAKELLFRVTKENMERSDIQNEISKINSIYLGAGLPISNYRKVHVDALKNYYNEYLGQGISFEYDGYLFNLKMEKCGVYPQGEAAAFARSNKVIDEYDSYYIIDIGGYTVDIAHRENRKPCEDAISLNMGIIIMYDNIKNYIYSNYDININNKIIEDVLSGKPTVLPDEVCAAIRTLTVQHAASIINTIKQKGILLGALPCIFNGGGSNLLKKGLLQSPVINKNSVFFNTDIKANAKGYAKLLAIELA